MFEGIENVDFVVCMVCDRRMKVVTGKHLQFKHGLTMSQYRQQFPGVVVVCDSTRLLHEQRGAETTEIRRHGMLQWYKTEEGKQYKQWRKETFRLDPSARKRQGQSLSSWYLTPGGQTEIERRRLIKPNLNRTFDAVVRKKMGEKNIGRKMLPTTIVGMKLKLTGRPNLKNKNRVVSPEAREKIRIGNIGRSNRSSGNQHRGNAYFRHDLGFFLRSSFEANYARILRLTNTPFKYESNRFFLFDSTTTKKITSYCPDFFFPETNSYVELKGWMSPEDEWKLAEFQKQYPTVPLKVLMQDSNEWLLSVAKYCDQILEWEVDKSEINRAKRLKLEISK